MCAAVFVFFFSFFCIFFFFFKQKTAYEIYQCDWSSDVCSSDLKEDPIFPPPDQPAPKVSIILPVLNEADTISVSVRSIQEQDYPNIEIIVIDDGSTDNSADVCRKLASQGLVKFFPLIERQGKSGALNYGCQLATGQFLVFMDSDSTLDRRAITNLLKPFHDERIGAVGGNVGVRNTYTNILTQLQTFEYLCSITVGRQFRAKMGILGIISGAFGAFRKDLVERVGWYEPGPGADSDLTIRIRKLGKEIAFVPSAVCLTNVPTQWKKWGKQRLRWDRNVVKNRLRKHRDTFNIFHHHFRVRNLLSFLDTLFFSLILAFLWVGYVIQVLIQHPDNLGLILFVNFCLFSMTKLTQLLIALSISNQGFGNLRLAWVFPCMIVYRGLERIIRIVASLQELIFRSSYRDPFSPPKVQKQMAVY